MNSRISLMITAPASDSGKTAITCGLLALMKKRGARVCAFKCGPDYIDPMFHRSVLDIESRNLDVFLAGEEGVREVFSEGVRGMDACICEGVMGYYDGSPDDSEPAKASPWHISTLLGIPSILVVRPKGSALSIAAVIEGIARFRDPSNIAGVILNDCSKNYYENYGRLIESQCGVPVLGYLPHMDEAEFKSRHLGLMTAHEIVDIRQRIEAIAAQMEETIDMDRLIMLTSKSGEDRGRTRHEDGIDPVVDIAVARDEAFCFTYYEALEALENAGARLRFFSPLKDDSLPDNVVGLYLPGGYPELHARELFQNTSMREQIKDAVRSGLPTVAECGGFMYLGTSLEDDRGEDWPMTGVLPGRSKNAGHLVRFGYGHIVADRDTMLFRKGEKIPVHEFHYWDTDDKGSDMELIKARDKSRRRFGFSTDSLYAGYPHLYMAGNSKPARRFVQAAASFSDKVNRT